MKFMFAAVCATAIALASTSAADAKGCIKGAIVGGVAGHMAGHGKLGAAVGCVVGHHEANKAEPNKNSPQSQPEHRGKVRVLSEAHSWPVREVKSARGPLSPSSQARLGAQQRKATYAAPQGAFSVPA